MDAYKISKKTSLRNNYFKYELDYGVNTVTGDFSNLNYEEDGTAKIGLLVNQEITDANPSNTYTLRLWLSYDPDNDQTSLLTGTAETRVFNAHILASGQNGKCEVQGS